MPWAIGIEMCHNLKRYDIFYMILNDKQQTN